MIYGSGSSKFPVTSIASSDRCGLLRLINNIRHKFSPIECVLSLIRQLFILLLSPSLNDAMITALGFLLCFHYDS